MSWLQLTIAVRTQEAARFEEVLVANGAVAITFESQIDEVVLEPAPGEIPLWEHISLLALFPVAASISGLNGALRALDPDIHQRLDVAFIAEEDWQKRLANHTVRAEFGGRLWLLPKRESAQYAGLAEVPAESAPADKAVLYLRQGWLSVAAVIPQHACALNGLLATSCRTKRCWILAVVLEFWLLPQPCWAPVLWLWITMTKRFWRLGKTPVNQVSDRIAILSLTEFENRQQRWAGDFDVVVANILASPVIDLAPVFSQALARPGQLVLSGILDRQAQQVVDSYPQVDFAPMTSEAEWVCLTGKLG